MTRIPSRGYLLFSRFIGGAMLLCLSLLPACEENSEVDLSANVAAANTALYIHNNLNFVFGLIVKAESDTLLALTGSSVIDSANVTADTALHTLSFLFNNKRCPDSVFRSGMIRATSTGPLSLTGSRVVVEFFDYVVDVDTWSGKDTLINKGPEGSFSSLISSRVSHGEILKGLGGTIVRYSFSAGFKTNFPVTHRSDIADWYMFSTLEGVTETGVAFSTEGMDSLRAGPACPYIVSGKIAVTVLSAEIPEGFIDFVGEDGCSANTIYNFGGNVFLNERLKQNRP